MWCGSGTQIALEIIVLHTTNDWILPKDVNDLVLVSIGGGVN